MAANRWGPWERPVEMGPESGHEALYSFLRALGWSVLFLCNSYLSILVPLLHGQDAIWVDTETPIFCLFAWRLVISLYLLLNTILFINHFILWASLVVQMITGWQCRRPHVWSLGWEDPLKKRMPTHSSILAWKILWTEEPGGLQSMRSHRVGHDWPTNVSF